MNRLPSLLAAIAGLCLAPASAIAQPAPDPAALDLARLLMARDETLYDDSDLGRIQGRIAEQLLESNACDPYAAECQAEATAVAREFAPAYRQAERVRLELITAHLIADQFRPEQATHVAQYLRGEEGSRLLDTLALLRRPERTAQRRRELERAVGRTDPRASAAALGRFRERTRYLPRARPR